MCALLFTTTRKKIKINLNHTFSQKRVTDTYSHIHLRGASILKNQLSKPAIVLSAGIIIIIALGIGLHSPIDRQLHRWKVLPEPERLTELYFTNPNQLPSHYRPGQTETVKFTVHNLEYKTVTYHYTVEQVSQNNNHKLPLASGSFTLPQNGFAHPQAQITLGDLDRSRVSVTITPTSENISYWITQG